MAGEENHQTDPLVASDEASAGSAGVVRRYRIDVKQTTSDAVLAALPFGPDDGGRPPLYEAVDVDRLDALFRDRSHGDCEVRFTYEEFEVTVTDREVVVRQAGPPVDT